MRRIKIKFIKWLVSKLDLWEMKQLEMYLETKIALELEDVAKKSGQDQAKVIEEYKQKRNNE